MLSKYFNNTVLVEDDGIIQKFIATKRVHQKILDIGDRTVCMMLRNINTRMEYKYEKDIAIMIKYVNDAVIRLRKYKTDFDKTWWNNKKDIHFNRSLFNSYYKEISYNIIKDIKHPLFIKMRDMYDIITDMNLRSFILEIVYYTYKINLQLYEYENLNIPLSGAGRNYTHQWSKMLHIIKNHKDLIFDPYIIQAIERNHNFSFNKIIKNGKFISFNNSFEDFKTNFDFSRKPVIDLLKTKKYDTVIELGSGWGRNMFYYKSLLPNLEFSIFMGEYTPGGIAAGNAIKNKYFTNKNIYQYHFNYNAPELFFEKVKMNKKIERCIVTSFWSVEQITHITPKLFDEILAIAPHIVGIHIEPIGWQISNKSLMKENVDGYRSYYNKNFYSILRRLEEAGKIKIKSIKLDFFNFGEAQSCGTLIIWEKI